MKIDPHAPAFPRAGFVSAYPNPLSGPCVGLTVRQHFAAVAMQGVLADPNVKLSEPEQFEDVARLAVRLADALIAELNK